MRQKNATPNKSQTLSLKKAGLSPVVWTVIKELDHILIVRHRITGTVKTIQREGVAEWAQQ